MVLLKAVGRLERIRSPSAQIRSPSAQIRSPAAPIHGPTVRIRSRLQVGSAVRIVAGTNDPHASASPSLWNFVSSRAGTVITSLEGCWRKDVGTVLTLFSASAGWCESPPVDQRVPKKQKMSTLTGPLFPRSLTTVRSPTVEGDGRGESPDFGTFGDIRRCWLGKSGSANANKSSRG
jgi:hypothetical protein